MRSALLMLATNECDVTFGSYDKQKLLNWTNLGYLLCWLTTRPRAHALVARRADGDGGLPMNTGFRWLQQLEPLCSGAVG
jgi:hypothetical protein